MVFTSLETQSVKPQAVIEDLHWSKSSHSSGMLADIRWNVLVLSHLDAFAHLSFGQSAIRLPIYRSRDLKEMINETIYTY